MPTDKPQSGSGLLSEIITIFCLILLPCVPLLVFYAIKIISASVTPSAQDAIIGSFFGLTTSILAWLVHAMCKDEEPYRKWSIRGIWVGATLVLNLLATFSGVALFTVYSVLHTGRGRPDEFGMPFDVFCKVIYWTMLTVSISALISYMVVFVPAVVVVERQTVRRD
jgi:hypothetical protein